MSPGTALDLATNDPNNPLTRGFYSGVFADGSPSFAGYGDYTGVGYRYTLGGNVLVSSSVYSRGVHSAYYGKLAVVNEKGKYFVDHPDLHWVKTNHTNVNSTKGGIPIASTNGFVSKVVRLNMTFNGQVYQAVGYLWPSGRSYFWNATRKYEQTVDFSVIYEVLVCDSSLNPTTTKATTLAPIVSLAPGSSLTSDQVMTSTEGCALKLSGGDLVLTDAFGNVVWRAGISGGQTLVNLDGIISVLDEVEKEIWSIEGPLGSTFMIQNCQLVLVSAGVKVWSSVDGYLSASTSKFQEV